MPRPSAPPPPECPRCGYDLSGAIAAWPLDSCPCDGRCSECGLAMLWRDVLNPAYAVSDLFFETAKRKIVRAFFRTWWQSLRPWKLWQGAQMQFAVNAGRLALFLVLGITLVWLTGTVASVAASCFDRTMYIVKYGGLPNLQAITDSLAYALWPIDMSWRWPRGFRMPPWLVFGWLWLFGSLLMLRLVPQTLRRAKVKRSHITRIWAYSLIGLPILVYIPSIGNALMRTFPWIESIAGPVILDHRGLVALVVLALWGGWIGLCWGSAAKHYLRLERPWTVAIVLVFLGGLAVVTLAVVATLVSADAMAWMMDELT